MILLFRLRSRLQGSGAPGKGAPGKVVVVAPSEHWTVGGGQKDCGKNISKQFFLNKTLCVVTGYSRRGARCCYEG